MQHALEEVSADSFVAHVRFLADDALLGRESGSPGYEEAMTWREYQDRLAAGEVGQIEPPQHR